jgi:YD repeat-containing protein
MNKPTELPQGRHRRTNRWPWLIGLLAGSAWAQSPTTQFEYDAEGNQTRILAPLNRNAVTAYDALRRPVQTTDAVGGAVRLGLDGQGRPVAVTDPRNLATGYQYSGLGDLVQLNSPDTGTTQYTHDAAGNILTRTDAKGQTTSYQYDALDRPVLVTYHDGSRAAYG